MQSTFVQLKNVSATVLNVDAKFQKISKKVFLLPYEPKLDMCTFWTF